MELSIVIPIYNEAENVEHLINRLRQATAAIVGDYEIILIDDGSSDATWEIVESIAREDKTIKGIKLSRNFGHQKAIVAGLEYSSGKAIITMDGDLQHPPELIPELIAHWQQGCKIVSTRRIDTEDTSFFKRWTSRSYYRLFSYFADLQLDGGSSDFRLMDRTALDALLAMGDADMFIRGAVKWIGFDSTTVDYVVESRLHGESKFNLRKMLHFASNGIMAFSSKPLKLGVWIGILTSLFSLLFVAYIVYSYFQGDTVQGWASLAGLQSFLMGILFILIGVIGSYLSRIHQVLQQRPRFVVSHTLGFDDEESS